VVRTWDNATKERYRTVAPDGTKINHEEDFYLSTHEHYGMWRSHYWSHVLARLASERHISGVSIFLASGEHLIKIFMNVYKRKENLDPSMSRSSRLPKLHPGDLARPLRDLRPCWRALTNVSTLRIFQRPNFIRHVSCQRRPTPDHGFLYSSESMSIKPSKRWN
jgi:hypothetical protein